MYNKEMFLSTHFYQMKKLKNFYKEDMKLNKLKKKIKNSNYFSLKKLEILIN